MESLTVHMHSWSVILAGGDGIRLHTLTRLISGDDRPKQFCPILGAETLLTQTRQRLGPVISPARTLFVVVKAHEPFYTDELGDVEPSRIVVQPRNKGTVAAILYSLVRIMEDDEEAVVAFFPADHYYSKTEPFLAAVDSAFRMARDRPRSLVLLGAEPAHPEVEYGWIERGAGLKRRASERVYHVNRFWEKPSLQIARELLRRGCLWNTFVMVGRATSFVDLLRSRAPDQFRAFEQLRQPNVALDAESVHRVYDSLLQADFSQKVLSTCTERLLVLRLNVGWCDLGKPERVLATLAQAGIEPGWATALSGEERAYSATA